MVLVIALSTIRFEIPNEFSSTKQDCFALLLSKAIMVRSEFAHFFKCAYQLLHKKCHGSIHGLCYCGLEWIDTRTIPRTGSFCQKQSLLKYLGYSVRELEFHQSLQKDEINCRPNWGRLQYRSTITHS